MTRTLLAFADLLVGLVAPKAEAAACTPSSYNKYCYCASYRVYTKACTLDYYCHESCGSCRQTSTRC
jgi:hypothetical protein